MDGRAGAFNLSKVNESTFSMLFLLRKYLIKASRVRQRENP